MIIECVRCGEVFTDARAFEDHDPGCKSRPLVASPDEWRWRTEGRSGAAEYSARERQEE